MRCVRSLRPDRAPMYGFAGHTARTMNPLRTTHPNRVPAARAGSGGTARRCPRRADRTSDQIPRRGLGRYSDSSCTGPRATRVDVALLERGLDHDLVDDLERRVL